MKMHTCWTAYAMSGRVKVRYCRAPTRLRYKVGYSTGGLLEASSLGLVSAGVMHDLQSVMLARCKMSAASFVIVKTVPWSCVLPRYQRNDVEDQDRSFQTRNEEAK